MPFQTKNDRLSCPQNEGMNHFLKSSFWGLEPYRFWTAENQNLILRVWSLPIISPENQDLILRSWSNQSDKMSLWSCPDRVDILSTRWPPYCVAILDTRLPPHRVLILSTRCAISKERKVAPKRAQIRPDSRHPHGYPPHASKRHTGRSWGHTRELADIMSVRYVGASVPR